MQKFLQYCLSFTFLLLLVSAKVNAQDPGDFLKVGANDAELLVSQYMEPLVVGLGMGMSNGWYNTAKPHNTLGFDITVSFHGVLIPENKRFFTFDPDLYQNTSLAPGSTTDQGPTIFGPGNSDLELRYTVTEENTGNTVSGTFTTPGGIGMEDYVGFNMIPAPVVQGSIGVIKNTEVIIRYVPKIEVDNFAFDQIGFGIKHDIFQWVPVLSRLPIDVSALFAYTKLNNVYDISDAGIDGSGQTSSFGVDTWNAQLLVSKKLAILTFYGGLGYSNIKSDLAINGTYTFEDENDPNNTVTVEDPVDFTYKTSGMRGTLGFRLKLGFFTNKTKKSPETTEQKVTLHRKFPDHKNATT
jgi:hypothetical protein